LIWHCLRRLPFAFAKKEAKRFWAGLSQWLKEPKQKNLLDRLSNQLKHNASNRFLLLCINGKEVAEGKFKSSTKPPL